MSKPITATEARQIATDSKDPADAKRLAKAGPAVDAAMVAIRTAAEDAKDEVTLSVDADVLVQVQTALSLAGFAVHSQRSADAIRTVVVTWKAP